MRVTIPLPVAILVLLPFSLCAEDGVPTRAVAILKQHCWKCHGPDRQEGGLRLDSREAVLLGGDGFGPAVIVRKSGESPLVRFTARADAELKMPPKGERLSESEMAVLRGWIDAGAAWPEGAFLTSKAGSHWAFQPVLRPAVPSSTSDGLRNPIDAFIRQRLEQAGLRPAPEADRRTLIRRLSFDLLGLPPLPEDVEEFVRDPDPLAYERLVDRCLASPHHGERWARHWLDVVRFAESHGFEMNQARPNAWRYRDYVIQALNRDLPYDQFIREQLAGDVLGVDEATGFLVGGPWDQVKSPDPVLTAQQRADELHDMVSTTGSAFLGLTVGCARCHTHKFDPIPHTDYYALKACFEGVQHGERDLKGPNSAEREQKARQLRERLDRIAGELLHFEPLASPGRTIAIYPDDPKRTAQLVPAQGPAKLAAGPERGAADASGDATTLPTLSAGYLYWKAKNQDVFAWSPRAAGRFRVWVSWGCGWSTHATDARYILDRGGDRREIGHVDQQRFADGSGDMPGKPLWSGFRDLGTHELSPGSRLVLRAGEQNAVVSADAVVLEEVTGTEPPHAQPALRLPVTRSRNVERFAPVEARFVRFTILATSQLEPCLDELEVFTAASQPANVALARSGTKATASSTLPGYAIHQLKHVNDGRYGNDWSWISNESGRGWVQLEFPQPFLIDRVEWSRDRDNVPRYNDRVATEYVIEVSRDGQSWTKVASSADRLPLRQPPLKVPGEALFAAGSADGFARLKSLLDERQSAQAALAAATAMPAVYAGRFVAPGATMRLHRGDATQPREPVPPGSLSQFGERFTLPGDSAESERRRQLADWIASPKNPLTARVIVNRLWQHHFGEGIVNTPSDFGANGGRPSHSELLDWLATELVSPSGGGSAWSLKSLHRLICLSATYRQSSAADARAAAVDGGNRLLWRFAPQRLEAEPLRDAILSATGRLDRRMGGAGFDLFEPNSNYVKVYTPKQSFGPAEFRRMVYQSKPRMQLEDTFGAFDCPDAGQIAPRRSQSTTPLQALNLLNSPFLIQQSEFLATRVRQDAGADIPAQIRRSFQLCFQREPSADEIASAEMLVQKHGLPSLCRALLNASEFLMVY